MREVSPVGMFAPPLGPTSTVNRSKCSVTSFRLLKFLNATVSIIVRVVYHNPARHSKRYARFFLRFTRNSHTTLLRRVVVETKTV
jgi:hypothetical protein